MLYLIYLCWRLKFNKWFIVQNTFCFLSKNTTLHITITQTCYLYFSTATSYKNVIYFCHVYNIKCHLPHLSFSVRKALKFRHKYDITLLYLAWSTHHSKKKDVMWKKMFVFEDYWRFKSIFTVMVEIWNVSKMHEIIIRSIS